MLVAWQGALIVDFRCFSWAVVFRRVMYKDMNTNYVFALTGRKVTNPTTEAYM